MNRSSYIIAFASSILFGCSKESPTATPENGTSIGSDGGQSGTDSGADGAAGTAYGSDSGVTETDPTGRSFNPSHFIVGGDSSCEQIDAPPTTCGWLLSFDAVIVGNVSAVSAVRSPSATNLGTAPAIIYTAPEECPGEIGPALDVTLTDVTWVRGSGPREVTVRFPHGISGSWNPPVLFDAKGDPYWFEDKGLLIHDTVGIGVMSVSAAGDSYWTGTNIPAFTFDELGGILHPTIGKCGLRYPNDFEGLAFADLVTTASTCTDADDIAIGTKWKRATAGQQANPVNSYAASCNWDDPPPSCSLDACPKG